MVLRCARLARGLRYYEALFFYDTDVWQNLFFLRVNMIENLLCLGLIPFIYKTVYGFVICNL